VSFECTIKTERARFEYLSIKSFSIINFLISH
jgi:hypothetical protein